MQKFIFVRRSHGVSKKGNDYDMTEVSNGISSFTLSNTKEVAEQIKELNLQEGDEFNAEVQVNVTMGSLRGTIVRIDA